mgnify:FL=1|tara:strand:+ start:186 stop:626 length:441 start_codon:yes stop_codon:yes gene_type:complete
MAKVDTEYMGMSTERRRAIESGDMKAARRISAAMKAYATKNKLTKEAIRASNSAALQAVAEGNNKGGLKTKKVPAVKISVGMVELPKGKDKAKMMRGGMANKKLHMYTGGGAVKDNLKPMPKGPKGKGVRSLSDSVQMNMGFDPES